MSASSTVGSDILARIHMPRIFRIPLGPTIDWKVDSLVLVASSCLQTNFETLVLRQARGPNQPAYVFHLP